MSEWNDMILTQKGLNLQAKVEAGKCELELLRVELGSGTPEEAENIQELTALKNHEINVGISDKTPKDGGICTITGIITNQDVNIGFYAKEMGVIAKDPDAGEILYMYATDNNPDFVPAKTSKYVVNASYSIDVAISNAEMINAKIDSAGLVTVSILNHYIENHNEDNTTHANLFKTLFNITEVNATKIKDKIKSYGKEVVQELFGITSATTDNLKTKIKEWAQEQINSWLETLGIRYNIAQNGYICLGKLFGDAIIQWGLCNILQNQQIMIKELNISWSYCIACACILEEAGQFSLIKWLDKQSNGHNIKFMSQNKATDEDGIWFSFISIGK